MVSTPEELRAFTTNLSMGTWTASAIAGLLASGLAGHLREPRSLDELAALCPSLPRSRIENCIGVARASGIVLEEQNKLRLAGGMMPFAQEPGRSALLGDLRTHLMQSLVYLDAMRDGAKKDGWSHTDVEILQSQGDASKALAPMIKMVFAPKLGDLSARIEKPGARFLDVGVGVGSLAIAMAQVFPNLHVLGLDVYDPSLELARANVARAKLGDRVKIEKCPVEELREEACFTLAWLPTFFVPDVEGAIARIHAAVAPGGFFLCGVKAMASDARARAVWSLINDEWGGAQLPPADAEALLRRVGFVDVTTLPGPDWAPAMVVGRRP